MTDKFTRRELLRLGLTGSVAGVLPALSFADRRSTAVSAAVSGLALVNPSPPLTPYVDALPIPPRRPADGTLAMAEAMHSYHRDLPAVPSWGYGGQTHLGPTLEAQSGQTATVTFANDLGSHIFPDCINTNTDGVEATDKTAPRTSVHLHGAPNRPEYDGHPMATFLPGAARTYEFNNDLSATTLFYHDHAMGLTQLNVYAGLSGMYWVRDGWDTGQASNPLGLPSGNYEIPLIFKECLLDSDGQLRAYMSHLFADDVLMPAFLGDTMLVNGKAWPNLNVDRGLYRFRLLNASTETGYDLHFSNQMTFWVIGSEGGLLDAPVAVTHLPIGAGERYDVLVDFSKAQAGDPIELLNREPVPGLARIAGMKRIPNLMQFSVGAASGFTGAVPTTLRGGRDQPARLPALTTADKVRTVSLLMNAAPNFPYVDLTLNNLGFEDPDIEMPVQGTTEAWDIVNTTPIPHTIHLHLVQFRIVNRQKIHTGRYGRANKRPPVGTRYAPPVDGFTKPFSLDAAGDWEAGFKDVVICPADAVTRIRVRFPTAAELGFDPDAVVGTGQDGVPIQGYVWHCHMLDHEDHVMMLRYRVVAPGTPAPAAVPAAVRRAYCRTPRP
jgi:FtsP/CotA-like multicopper oxidase with cupredoxin domain